jgi:hypothetical protein
MDPDNAGMIGSVFWSGCSLGPGWGALESILTNNGIKQPFRSVAQPCRAAERSQDVLQQNDWVERRFVFWWTRKNDTLPSLKLSFGCWCLKIPIK